MDKIIYENVLNGNIQPYEEELIENLRKITYQGIPLSIILSSKVLCRHQCYYTSVYLTRGMDSFNLVRGNINSYLIVDYPNHCWVEKDDWVYDPSDGFKYKKDLYYQMYNPDIIERYDEVTCKNDKIYCNVLEQCMKKPEPLMMEFILKSLIYIEKNKAAANSEFLISEIKRFEQNNPYVYKISENNVKEFIDFCFEKDSLGYKLKNI